MTDEKTYDPQTSNHTNKLDWWLAKSSLTNEEFGEKVAKAEERSKPYTDSCVHHWRSGKRKPRDNATLKAIEKVTRRQVKIEDMFT